MRDGLLVSVRDQTVSLIRNGEVLRLYPCSTASAGTGCKENSCQTPTGLHQVVELIGAGLPSGAVFVERVWTGDVWSKGAASGRDLILTRVMRLMGMEEGVNRGTGVDSFSRCIYIHGTDREDLLGTPASHGCIRMGNADIIELFEMLREGDQVLVD